MKLAAVGDNCMDVYDEIGEAYPGGNPVNVAVYFVRLGGCASYTGAVGTDQYGRLMADAVSAKGVDTSHIHFSKGNTAITHVELIDGERIFGDYDEGVLADFKLSAEDLEFLCQHDLVVSGLWGKVENDLEAIRKRGVKVAFDAATRPDDAASITAIPHVNYLFFATDDGETEQLREKMKEIYRKGPELVIATLGEKGSIVFNGNEFERFGIVPCNVVDTMGAGDSYIAGFLKGILEGKAIKECMEMGASNSSITLEYRGAW
ncbi:fructoselysine 6-kinase [Anaerosacchariphilus polymeriproducens]|uniref:Fructoselysine 6-kinase n=1 Tax=Anaerosacchariphilus polymeriproducens TaxID=1812858 RepID=A0A371AWD3_9FIRM|nr:fructoselysine 6-kinase [Anaerosacchariphilus polymeriproducens]RDU23842.1 fructoselysine 6-kinase [Anaerosacchariphilus polymeriproducens]